MNVLIRRGISFLCVFVRVWQAGRALCSCTAFVYVTGVRGVLIIHALMNSALRKSQGCISSEYAPYIVGVQIYLFSFKLHFFFSLCLCLLDEGILTCDRSRCFVM